MFAHVTMIPFADRNQKSAMMRSPGWCARVFGHGVQQALHPQGEQKRFVVQPVQQVCWRHICAAVLPKMIWSIFPQSFTVRKTLAPFLASASRHSIAHQDPRCHRELVEVVRGDVGLAPRDLDRSLVFRQGLLQSGPE